MLQSRSSCAQDTKKPNENVGVWSRERFNAGLCKEMGDSLLAPNLEFPDGFQQDIFKGKVKEGYGWLFQNS